MKYHIVPVTDFNQNCSIIWCQVSREAILVDPGGEKDKLCQAVDNLKVKIIKIVLTHGHIDHVGSAVELKKYYNVPLVGPNKCDQFLLNDLFIQCQLLNIDFPSSSCVVPDIWLEDKDQIQVGNEIFHVLHCPGHSPGHIVLWNKLSKFIIMGDVLFKKSIGRTDLPGGDYAALLKSIQTKLMVLEDNITFLPGHGPMSTIGFERLHNTFLSDIREF